MNKLSDKLNKRKTQLRSLEAKLCKKIEKLPKGTIYTIKNHKKAHFYFRDPAQDGKFCYIRDDDSLIHALLQKRYLLRLQEAAGKELTAIDLYLGHMPEVSAEEVYETFSGDEKERIVPELESDELFVRRWEGEKYESLREAEKLGIVAWNSAAVYDEDGDNIPVSESITDRGEVVRSKSECLIANMLNKNGIPYKYEKPLWLGGAQIYPDFTILDVRNRREIYLEHLGRLDDQDYLEKTVRKLNRYAGEGYHLGDRVLLTMETRAQPLNLPAAEKMVLFALARPEATEAAA